MHATVMTPTGASGRISSRLATATAAAVVGLALIGLGSLLPWVTLFRGLQEQPGFLLDGGKLAGVGIAVVALLLIGARVGGGQVVRTIAIAGSVGIVFDSLLVGSRIAAFVADPGPAGPLTQPAAGPGTALMAVGGALLLVAALAAPLRSDRLTRSTVASLVLGGSLFVAAWIHLLLTPEHLEEATILGVGFLLAGLAQLALAAAAVGLRARAGAWLSYSVIAVNTALIAVYANAVVIGLPFGGEEHAGMDGGLFRLGSGEAVDLYGLITTIVQLAAIVLALRALGSRTSADRDASRPA